MIGRKVVSLIALIMCAGAIYPLFAAGTPAGTVISSRASATYTSFGGTKADSIYSNLVNFVVKQAAAVNLSPALQSAETESDSVAAHFPLTITNSGNGADMIRLTGISSRKWFAGFFADKNQDKILQPEEFIAGPIDAVPSLAPDSSFAVIARVFIPADPSLGGMTDSTIVTLASSFDAAVQTAGLLVTTVNTPFLTDLNLRVDDAAPYAGKIVQFDFSLINKGTATASNVLLRYKYPDGLSVVSSVPQALQKPDMRSAEWDIGSVAPNASAAISFKMKIADSAKAGLIIDNFIDLFYTAGSRNVMLTSNDRQMIVAVDPAALYSVSLQQLSSNSAIESGDTIVYKFIGGNKGYNKDVLELSAVSSENLKWDFFKDSNRNGIFDPADQALRNTNGIAGVDLDTVMSSDSVTFFTRASLPFMQFDQTTDQTAFTLTSAGKPAEFKTSQLSTTVGIPIVEMNVVATALEKYLPGDSLTYTITYANAGHATIDSFFVVNKVPLNTSYVGNSVQVNGMLQQDDAVIVSETADAKIVRVGIGALKPNQPGIVSFKVRVR